VINLERLSVTKNKKMNEDQISKIILDCAFKVHTELGSGLLERVYQECLAYELKQKGLRVEI